ncbi:MAG: NAD(P)H-hydrate dehydratase [Vicinamibacterales bacterium]
MRILDTEQMREADRQTVEDVGIASIVLMENAGRQVVAAIESAFEELEMSRVAVLAGPGNNGGDGFVIARTLLERGIDVGVYLVGQASAVKGDARTNLTILKNLGLDVVEVGDAAAWELHGTDVLGSDLIVDALFGTGLHGPLTGLAQTIVDDINAGIRPVVSVDLPSGLSADTSEVLGPAVDATMTVTLAAPKLPLILPPGERLTGTLVIADIGIPHAIIEGLEGPHIEMLTRETMRDSIEPRSSESHKGDYGRVLIVAGSRGKTGAANLAAAGALRSGAGLVTVASPISVVPVIASLGSEYMTVGLAESADGSVAAEALETILAFEADVIAIGPGLGCTPTSIALVHGLVERAGVPLVLDADALNAFQGQTDRLMGREDIAIIITPHPGEMARLMGLTIDEVQKHRIDVAREFATTHRVHVVLKGHRSLIASPDGRVGVNLTGNAGMATGGSGDVLLGMIAAWLGQLLDAEAAARLAVYLHGLAGDLAAAHESEVALIAGDIISHLGEAVLDLTGAGANHASSRES